MGKKPINDDQFIQIIEETKKKMAFSEFKNLTLFNVLVTKSIEELFEYLKLKEFKNKNSNE